MVTIIAGVRSEFVHEATVELAAGSDERAPGAAVTAQLCGHWEHEGPCRWPHHTAIEHRGGRSLRIRTVFASEPGEEERVRQGIAGALLSGRLDGPTGVSTWKVVSHGASDVRSTEADLASRLARDPGVPPA